MVTYATLIQQLFADSGMQVKEYAEALPYSTTQLSNVLNAKEPGSWKLLRACLQLAGKTLEDCLKFPTNNNDSEDTLIEKLLILEAITAASIEAKYYCC